MKGLNLNVFEYVDLSKFLEDFYLAKKEKSKCFSYRQFARNANVSPSLLQDVIVGRRSLSEVAAVKFSSAMKLNKNESEYFLWVVRFNKAKTPEAKNAAFAEISRYRTKAKMKFLDQDQFDFYSQWYHSTVRLLTTFKCFDESPEWIANTLNPKITPKQAKDSLNLLERLKLLVRNSNGNLEISQGILSTDYELNSLAIRNYNRSMMTMGTESIDSIGREFREISTLQISISENGFKEIKERIRRFKEEIMEVAVNEKVDPELIYHMNLQLFPLTNLELKK